MRYDMDILNHTPKIMNKPYQSALMESASTLIFPIRQNEKQWDSGYTKHTKKIQNNFPRSSYSKGYNDSPRYILIAVMYYKKGHYILNITPTFMLHIPISVLFLFVCYCNVFYSLGFMATFEYFAFKMFLLLVSHPLLK